MDDIGRFLADFLPFLALAAVLAAIVVAVNVLGRRLSRHDAWLAAIDARVGNLDKDRRATWARRLQRPFGEPPPLVPPPLPHAPTQGAVDWEEELVKTERLQTKETGRYPLGVPPKGPSDDG